MAKRIVTETGTIIIVLIMSLLSARTVSAQDIRFTYDDAGNRIKREVIQIEQVIDFKDKNLKKFITRQQIDKEISVSADKYTDKIRIGINDDSFDGSMEVEIYSIAGYRMKGTQTEGRVTDIDISNLPKGIYVVILKYKDKSNVYKINYVKK